MAEVEQVAGAKTGGQVTSKYGLFSVKIWARAPASSVPVVRCFVGGGL